MVEERLHPVKTSSTNLWYVGEARNSFDLLNLRTVSGDSRAFLSTAEEEEMIHLWPNHLRFELIS